VSKKTKPTARHLLPDEPDEPENEPAPPPPPTDTPEDQSGRQEKTSYEASPEVQRWLRAQAEERAGAKPPFTPTFLAHQRDRLWVLSSLERFYEEDLITDVLHAVKSGKEATVYCCAAAPATGVAYLAAKVYRPRMFRSLKNDALYRHSRAQLDAEGHIVCNDRRWRAYQRSAHGHSERVAAWIAYEFATQRLLYDAGADVPQPRSQIGNALLMEYIGEGEDAAPTLREVEVSRDEAILLFERVLRNIELFLARDCIHGDLSAYNLLYQPGKIIAIDFAQAVDPRYNLEVYPLLLRDVERVCQYFARYGVEADAEALASDLWARYLHGDL
jgi:RIO kinase 1